MAKPSSVDRGPDGNSERETLPEWVRRPDIITIEGLAATGKGAISTELVERYDFRYLNISAIARGLAVGFAERFPWINPEAAPEDCEKTIEAFYRTADVGVGVGENGMQTRVRIDGEEVTDRLHTPATGALASYLFRFPTVRGRVADFARDYAAGGNIILDGRLVAATVAPEADLHIFLEATRDERIERRFKQRQAADPEITREAVAAELDARDEKERIGGAHIPYGGSLLVETTGRTLRGSAREIVNVYNTLRDLEPDPTSRPASGGLRRGRLGWPSRGDRSRSDSHPPHRPWTG